MIHPGQRTGQTTGQAGQLSVGQPDRQAGVYTPVLSDGPRRPPLRRKETICSWLRLIRDGKPHPGNWWVLPQSARLHAHNCAVEAGHHVCPEGVGFPEEGETE